MERNHLLNFSNRREVLLIELVEVCTLRKLREQDKMIFLRGFLKPSQHFGHKRYASNTEGRKEGRDS